MTNRISFNPQISFTKALKPAEKQTVQQQEIKTEQPKYAKTPLNAHRAYCAININFAGKYDPTDKEMAMVSEALHGGKRAEECGPDYFPTRDTVNSLFSLINENKTLEESTIQDLAKSKAQVHNNFILTKLGGETKKPESFEKEAKDFVHELKTESKILKSTLKDIGLGDKELQIMDLFIATTGPMLYKMGFADAIPHAAQVARKCAIEAKSQTSEKSEILKSAMVGWLHDPKVPGNVSFSNLATHPAIGGVIAKDVLTKNPEFEGLLTQLLGDSSKTNKFIKNVSESLFINNDSEWVMNNVILHKNKYIPGAQDGIADKAPDIEDTMIQRFKAPSKGEEPKEISPKDLKTLEHMKFDTGIRGINKKAFEQILPEVSKNFSEIKDKSPQEVYKGIMNGEISNPELINTLKEKLTDNNGITESKISGSVLLCHHMETEEGKIAAKTLIEADPMLLSPHKIVMSGFEPTSIGRISSFMKSFDGNINGLPKEDNEKGKAWQKELLISMMKAADELSDNKKSINYNTMSINELAEKLSNAETWGDYGNLDTKNPENKGKLQEMSDVIKKHYDKAAEESKNMFNIADLKE